MESLRVLIVEDSQDDALLIVRELKKGGFSPIWERVQSSSELKAVLRQQSWDMILSDYSMPQFNAIDAIKIVREVSPELPCIVISGTIGEDVAVAAMQAGAQDFFVKGKLTRLPAAIRRQLSEAEVLRQKHRVEAELHESEARRWRENEESLKREVEARKKIEALYQEAQESNRLKEEFLHNLSHELRTPMNAITGWAEFLSSGLCSPDEYAEIHSAIYRNSLAQNKLINHLLDESAMSRGRFTIERRPVDLTEVARAATLEIANQAREKKIRLVTGGENSPAVVIGDRLRLQEVVANLLSNALKFTPGGGCVEVAIRRSDSNIELSVKDTGEGIDPDFLPHIFERFRQADGGLTRKHGGLGLGLSIVRHLVNLHGGEIEARSQGRDRGATMTVRFPIADLKNVT